MPTLELSEDQVVDLVGQLPTTTKSTVFRHLLLSRWPEWEALSRYGQERARTVAASRGKNWDGMTEDERDAFVVEILHED